VEGRHEQTEETRRYRLTVSLFHFLLVSLLVCLLFFYCCLVLFSLVEMETRGWQSKGDKAPRRSPRRRGNTYQRPFKAPKPFKEVQTSEVQLVVQDRQDINDGQVQIISETENERDIQARQDLEPHVIPFIPCIKLMSEREATEVARHGEVLRWSSDEEGDKTQKTTLASDTTGSTPDMFKSPETREERVPGSIVTDTIHNYVIQSSPKRQSYEGVSYVRETEIQASSIQSPDSRPVAKSLRPREKTSLTQEQIKDCQEGPKGDRAIGVTVAKTSDSVEFRGVIDKFRGERGRYIYHVTYTGDDEEELSQKELLDGFLLALAPQIEAEWAKFKNMKKGKTTDYSSDSSARGDSDGEGSLYDKESDEDELDKRQKKKRRETKKRTSGKSTLKNALISGMVLPVDGEKTVATEAFGKLNAKQREILSDNINRKTKKVITLAILS
jgi:hypothetical protein